MLRLFLHCSINEMLRHYCSSLLCIVVTSLHYHPEYLCMVKCVLVVLMSWRNTNKITSIIAKQWIIGIFTDSFQKKIYDGSGIINNIYIPKLLHKFKVVVIYLVVQYTEDAYQQYDIGSAHSVAYSSYSSVYIKCTKTSNCKESRSLPHNYSSHYKATAIYTIQY